MATAETSQHAPTAARTGQQFLDGLRGDAREIWLNGEKITHPLEHPQLAEAARTMARVYDLQHQHAAEMLAPSPDDGRLVNVFLKCEASQDGHVRGRRNAMLDDSDVHWHRQIKSCVGGVTASVTGDPAVFVSVSAAHQGPDGGGPVAAIVDLG